MKRKVRVSVSGNVFVMIFAFVIGVFVALSFWTDRNLDFFVSYFKGSPVDVPFWLSALVTILLNGLILVANIIAEIVRLAL